MNTQLSLLQKDPLTVTQLSALLKNHVENEFASVVVKAEISGYKQHSSGHHYFTLKDAESILDAVCWKSTPLGVKLTEGLHVVCYGRITTYPLRSKYQMIVQKIEGEGIGQLLAALEALKKKLLEEGLFDKERKKNLPIFPEKIGIITSETGAVIQDMLHRLSERMPVHVCLYPATVQGALAVPEILAGLDFFEKMENKVDVVIIARGGGSIEDLFAFNDERLVRRVALYSLPTISAVGHETDTTLIDYAADMRAPTPTAAAEFVVKTRKEWQQILMQMKTRAQSLIEQFYQKKISDVLFFSEKLKNFLYRCENLELRLDDLQDALEKNLKRNLQKQENILEKFLSQLQRYQPFSLLLLKESEVLEQKQSLIQKIQRCVQNQELSLNRYYSFLKEASYPRILEKGFTLIQNKKGSFIKSAGELRLDQEIQLSFLDGKAIATIQNISVAKIKNKETR